jgi:hypothetical protein
MPEPSAFCVIVNDPLKFCWIKPPTSVAVPDDVAAKVKYPLMFTFWPPINEMLTPVDVPASSMVVTPVLPLPVPTIAPGDPPKLRIDSARAAEPTADSSSIAAAEAAIQVVFARDLIDCPFAMVKYPEKTTG